MSNHDVDMMAHLMRRAGFGAPREELEARAAKGYEATVEELGTGGTTAPGSQRNDALPPVDLAARHATRHGRRPDRLHDTPNTK